MVRNIKNGRGNKPVEDRETIEVNGVSQKLPWIAENNPEVLVQRIAEGHSKSDAYWSSLYNAGYTYQGIVENCKGWGINPMQVFQQRQ